LADLYATEEKVHLGFLLNGTMRDSNELVAEYHEVLKFFTLLYLPGGNEGSDSVTISDALKTEEAQIDPKLDPAETHAAEDLEKEVQDPGVMTSIRDAPGLLAEMEQSCGSATPTGDLWYAFFLLDENRDGRIDTKEMSKVLKSVEEGVGPILEEKVAELSDMTSGKSATVAGLVRPFLQVVRKEIEKLHHVPTKISWSEFKQAYERPWRSLVTHDLVGYFAQMDADRSGDIDAKEIKESMGPDALKRTDFNQDGKIGYDEFVKRTVIHQWDDAAYRP
jgi:Ca2+-binding EF-hand superfamily protein